MQHLIMLSCIYLPPSLLDGELLQAIFRVQWCSPPSCHAVLVLFRENGRGSLMFLSLKIAFLLSLDDFPYNNSK